MICIFIKINIIFGRRYYVIFKKIKIIKKINVNNKIKHIKTHQKK